MSISRPSAQKVHVVLATILWMLASTISAAAASEITETTKVHGTVPVDLTGTWFLVGHAKMNEGKYRNYPQLIRVSREGEAGLTMSLLDVQLPKEMKRAIVAANEKQTAWTPSPKQLDALAKGWSKLPPSTDKDKDVMVGDVAYAHVTYEVAVPDTYAEAFPKQDDALKTLLANSGFTIYVVEGFRPLPVPEGKIVGQAIERKTVYGVQNAGDKVLAGPQLTGFLAAGLTSPLGFGFGGNFTMYRLAGPAKNGGPAPKK
jgi:hypothetical protein